MGRGLKIIEREQSYDQFAGQNTERLAALSDGIFAVAMTLLLLELHVPSKADIHNEAELWRVMAALWPQFLVYLMSFITLGIFWVGQQTQLNYFARSDRRLTWIHLAFLFGVTLLPFSTRLLAEFISYRPALLAYWVNVLFLGVMLYLSWGRVTRLGLLKADIPAEIQMVMRWRIVSAQMLYAFGAMLCIFSTYWSIGFIILVQLNYTFGPQLKRCS